MARVLDTREIAPPDVGDVVRDLFAHNVVPLDVAVDTTAPLVIDAAQIAHASLLSTRSRDLWLRRAESQTEEGIAFAMAARGRRMVRIQRQARPVTSRPAGCSSPTSQRPTATAPRGPTPPSRSR